MQRDEKVLSLVLKSERAGERDRIITLLSSDERLMRIRVYGAQKSAKSLKAPLFSEGVFSIYTSGSSSSLKDVDITNARLEILEDLDRMTAASLFSEITIFFRLFDNNAYSLLAKSLDALALGYNYRRVCIIYIVKALSLFGTFSDYERCPVCSRVYSKDEILGYNNIVASSCCQNCSTGEDGLILPPNARAFIKEVLKSDYSTALSFRLSVAQEDRIFRFLLRLVKEKSANGLETLSSGIWHLY